MYLAVLYLLLISLLSYSDYINLTVEKLLYRCHLFEDPGCCCV